MQFDGFLSLTKQGYTHTEATSSREVDMLMCSDSRAGGSAPLQAAGTTKSVFRCTVPCCTAVYLIWNIKKIHIDFVRICAPLCYHNGLFCHSKCMVRNRDSGLAGLWEVRVRGRRISHFQTIAAPEDRVFPAKEERASLEDPLSADGGVFAGQRQLGRL